jgi:TonB family protein
VMDAQLLSNLAAFWAQTACLIALAWLVSMVVRLDAAAVRYAWWRGVLALCVVLPWAQGRVALPADDTLAVPSVSLAVMSDAATVAVTDAPGSGVSWLAVLVAVLVAGALIRLAWLGVALVRLHRLRLAGDPLPADDLDALQDLLGTRAEVRVVRHLRQPVTFGVFRPVVLLPSDLAAHPAPIRQAVICHELMHVRRRDWLWLVTEEVLRAVLWFHPGIWWLVSRIQQAREEVVDEATVLATRQRRAYIEALVAFADAVPEAATAAFSPRNHLFRRIVLVSKEAAMSARRVVVSCALMALVVGTGGWYATDVFPLARRVAAQTQDLRVEPGPLERAAEEVTPENPIPRRIFSVAARYPPEGLVNRTRAIVSLRITVDERGSVGEVRRGTTSVLQADAPASLVEAFERAATDAVRRWQYDPPARAPISLDVMFRFEPDVEEAPETTRAATGQAAARVAAPGATGSGGGLTAGTPPESPATLLRIGGNIREPARIRHVSPVYPVIAQQARVAGVVIIEAVIGETGQVTYARVLRSIPLLDHAALEAVMQWQFAPTLLNGQAVPVMMTVTVNFTLN